MRSRLLAAIVVPFIASTSVGDEAARGFQVADVRASPPDALWAVSALREPTLWARAGQIRGGRYEIRSATLVDLIATAYSMDPARLVGGPAWLDTARFDVIGKIPPGSAAASPGGMLRLLLADRFHLRTHPDTAMFPEFALTAGSRGLLKLKATQGGESGCKPAGQPTETATVCHNMTMAQFAQMLPRVAPDYFQGNDLFDETHLTGSFDFNLRWTPRKAFVTPGTEGISLSNAIEKQLGLNLAVTQVPERVLVIDHADEVPTPNPPATAKLLPSLPFVFEVAVVKPTPPGVLHKSIRINPGGRLEIEAATLKTLIKWAWDIEDLDAIDNEELVSGIPKFADSVRYDITARPPAAGSADIESLKLMTRGLLVERFGLITHTERRSVTVLALTAYRPKLRPAAPRERSGCRNAPALPLSGMTSVPMFSLQCRNTSVREFAAKLQALGGPYVPYPAVDATGLSDGFDFTISWNPPHLVENSGPDPNGAFSLVEAIEKQMGLRLRKDRREMEVLVVDHLNPTPTAN